MMNEVSQLGEGMGVDALDECVTLLRQMGAASKKHFLLRLANRVFVAILLGIPLYMIKNPKDISEAHFMAMLYIPLIKGGVMEIRDRVRDKYLALLRSFEDTAQGVDPEDLALRMEQNGVKMPWPVDVHDDDSRRFWVT